MANIITAGNATNNGTSISSDTSGALNIVTGTGAGTTAVTINSSQVVNFTNLPTVAGSGFTASNLASGSAGVIPFQTGSGATSFTSAGTSGQVLTSAGTGTPTWSTPSAGAMTLISTQSMAGVSTISWTGLGSYTKFMLVVTDSLPVSSAGGFLVMQIGYGATPTYITSGYMTGFSVSSSGGGSTSSGGSYSTSKNFIYINPELPSTTNAFISESISFISSSVSGVSVTGNYGARNAANNYAAYMGVIYGGYQTPTVITAIQIANDSSVNFTYGSASLYGISS
jgi:hypothetical protein